MADGKTLLLLFSLCVASFHASQIQNTSELKCAEVKKIDDCLRLVSSKTKACIGEVKEKTRGLNLEQITENKEQQNFLAPLRQQTELLQLANYSSDLNNTSELSVPIFDGLLQNALYFPIVHNWTISLPQKAANSTCNDLKFALVSTLFTFNFTVDGRLLSPVFHRAQETLTMVNSRQKDTTDSIIRLVWRLMRELHLFTDLAVDKWSHLLAHCSDLVANK